MTHRGRQIRSAPNAVPQLVAGAIDRATLGTSRVIGRRKFLADIGRVAFTAGLTGGLLSIGYGDVAGAFGTCASPCGPSPLCASGECSTSAYGVCTGGAYERAYGGSSCKTTDANWWPEDWCTSSCSTGEFRCHDCCGQYWSSTGSCSNCGSETRWKCICRVKTASC